jgi:hypothetical protein
MFGAQEKVKKKIDVRETDVSVDNVVGDKQTARGGSVGVMMRLKTLTSTAKARVRCQSNWNLVRLHEALGLLTSTIWSPKRREHEYRGQID